MNATAAAVALNIAGDVACRHPFGGTFGRVMTAHFMYQLATSVGIKVAHKPACKLSIHRGLSGARPLLIVDVEILRDLPFGG
jgi:hypothetical protein